MVNQSILITGGSTNSTEQFDFQTMSWSKSTDLPYEIASGVTLPYKDSFVIIGGHDTDYTNTKSILFYDNLSNKWEILDVELEIGRADFTAFYVPDYFC